jgi:anti-anti-sigma factor
LDDDAALVIHAYAESDRHVLVLTGELDLSGVSTFEAAARRLCDLGARDILVDITRIDFIDSNGLRAVLTVKDQCEERACRLSMTHGAGHTEGLFELTRLKERLPFRKSGATRPRREIDLRTPAHEGDRDDPDPVA